MEYKGYIAHTQNERIQLELLKSLDELVKCFSKPMEIPAKVTRVETSEPVQKATPKRGANKK